jgi:peptidyl-dipeptidase A
MHTVAGDPAARETALHAFLERLEAELAPLHRELNEEIWLANVTGSPDHERRSAELDARLRLLFAQPEPYRFLLGTREAGGVPDTRLARQLDVLLRTYQSHQIPPAAIERMVRLEKSLESRFNNFRAELRGTRVGDNQIREVLQKSSDSRERREAWEASKQIGAQVREELLELVGERNTAARELGFSNYYSMMLELDELEEGELFRLLDELERGTRPLFEAYMRDLGQRLSRQFGIPAAELRPWHVRDPFFQDAPAADVDLDPHFAGRSLEALTTEFFSAIGLDIADLMARSDLYEKPGKCQHAFCMHIDRAQDIRVLCNLRPDEQWMGTMLHEFGHAAYDKYLDPRLPFFLRAPAHTLTTEASAMLFGRLSKNAAWLSRYARVPEVEARAAAAACARATREQLLVQTRWCLVMCHMERALYRDPAQDLDRLWWDLVERLQGLKRPEGRHAPDWASKIHFSVAPVYYHNYMLGEMMASQLQRHLLEHVLGDADAWDRYVTSPRVGEFLIRELYRPGKSTDWRGAVRRATGRDLEAAPFVAELAAANGA